MKKLFLATLTATTLLGLWSGCFVAKGNTGTKGTSSSSAGTGGTMGSSSATSSGVGNAGTGGVSGTGGFGVGGFGGVPVIDVVCNPVTNAGCSGGDACQPTVNGGLTGFACFPGPNTVADCSSCDPSGQTPPFCAPGSLCQPTDDLGTVWECARYCCDDADCSVLGHCSTVGSDGPRFTPVSATLGICLTPKLLIDAGTGDAGDAGLVDDAGPSDAGPVFDAGYHFDGGFVFDGGFHFDAGHGSDAGEGVDAGQGVDAGPPMTLDCHAPTTSPSTGSCVMLTL